MTPADRMAALIEQQTCQRVDFDALAGAADQGDSSLPTSPRRRQILAAAADELVQRRLVLLPVQSSGWDYSAEPRLPRWVQRVNRPRAKRTRPGPRAWVPALAFANHTRLSIADIDLLAPINNQIRDDPDAEIIPLCERAYQLYQDEKRLAKIERNHLVQAGLLSIAEHLRARPAPAPLSMFELGPAPWMLIVENSATFTSLRQILRTWPDRSQVGWLAHGSGDQLIASLPTAIETFEEREHPVTSIMLYGDLDIDGLECGQQANAKAGVVGLPPVVPACALYRALLGMLPRLLSPVDRNKLRAVLPWLPTPIASRAGDLLEAGFVLRQEALPLPELRRCLNPARPLFGQLRDTAGSAP